MSKLTLINIPQGYVSQAKDTNIDLDFWQFQRWKQMSIIKFIK